MHAPNRNPTYAGGLERRTSLKLATRKEEDHADVTGHAKPWRFMMQQDPIDPSISSIHALKRKTGRGSRYDLTDQSIDPI
jgi:hypothetical protein